MSIQTAKEVICDKCRAFVRIDGSVSREWATLAKAGWRRGGGKHTCPDCSRVHPRKVKRPVEFENADLGEEG